MRYPLLDVCARIEGHTTQHKLVQRFSSEVQNWQSLLQQAELEGLTPLLNKHLSESESVYPAWVKRSLHLSCKHHCRQAEMRIQVLLELLALLRKNGIETLLLKGSALAYTLYPDPALRPMRDIDLLLRPEDAQRAHDLLKAGGFTQAEAVIPPDHFHLPPLYRQAGKTSICIEIHRGLYPNCPPYYPKVDFNRLFKTGQRFRIGDGEAVTFADEEMLHYLYQHGFHAPLTYEPYKLINAADLIGFTERHCNSLDWEHIEKKFPLLYRALPMLHSIAPWDSAKVPARFLKDRRLEPRPYGGWPHKRLKDLKAAGNRLPEILAKTFLPSIWWLKLYYGADTTIKRLICLCWHHPRHIFWWARMYRLLAK